MKDRKLSIGIIDIYIYIYNKPKQFTVLYLHSLSLNIASQMDHDNICYKWLSNEQGFCSK